MAMVPGTEVEEMSHSEVWSDRLQTENFPLKVKNTFLAEDGLNDDEVDDAFRRRQVSAPATCANALPQSPMTGGLDGSLGFPRMQNFGLEEFSSSLSPVEEDTQKGGRRKKSDGVDRANAAGDNMQGSAMMAGNFAPASAMPPPPAWQNTTTVMMRNLPNKYTQRMLLTEINQTGFLGTFDFLYLPIDPDTNANRGYAFLNFIDSGFAWMFKMSYEGRKMNKFNSSKVVSVMAATLQGFEANYAHYTSARVNRGDPAARPLFLREPSQQAPQVGQQGGKGGGKGRKQQRPTGVNNSLDSLSMAQPSDIFAAQQALLMQSSAVTGGPPMTGMGQPPVPWNGENNLLGFQGYPHEQEQQDDSEVFGSGATEPMRVQSGFGAVGSTTKQSLVPKFCPHCGGPIQPHFQFCPHCGGTISFANLGE